MSGPNSSRRQPLDLALIGNSCVAALVDQQARIVWWCFPLFDGDPVFSRLVERRRREGLLRRHASWAEVDGIALRPQHRDCRDDPHRARTARSCGSPISRHASTASSARFIRRRSFGGWSRWPGMPRIAIRVRPTHNYGRPTSNAVVGSNHIRYVGGPHVVRLTTDAPLVLHRQRDHFPAHAAGQPGLWSGRAVPDRASTRPAANFSTTRASTGSTGREISPCRSNGRKRSCARRSR